MAQTDVTSGERIAAAHARLLQDRALQFTFSDPPKSPPLRGPPDWLEPLARFLQFIAPVMKYIVWGGLALVLLLVVAYVARELIGRRWPALRKARQVTRAEAPWRPDAAQAAALLGDADRLAAEGRYAEAAHILLLRSIADIQARRPDLVRPALTSRDIGALPVLAEQGRSAFGLIAQVVERSLFGGAPVDAAAFARCRQAYADFAQGSVAA